MPAFDAWKKGIQVALDSLIEKEHPTTGDIKKFLEATDFLRQQAGYVEGSLQKEWVRPTHPQLDKVRRLVELVQPPATQQQLQGLLAKATLERAWF